MAVCVLLACNGAQGDYTYELTNGAQDDYGMASAYKVLKPEIFPWNEEVQVTYVSSLL